MDSSAFLSGFTLRRVTLPTGSSFRARGLALGGGSSPLEVLVADAGTKPALATLRSAWKARKDRRAAPLLLVVLYGDKAALCGPTGEDAPAYVDLDPGQVERLCREALEQPDRHAALRCLRDALPTVETDLPGLRNEGFLATHELSRGIRHSERWREAWQHADRKARGILSNRNDTLLRSLGFQIEKVDK